jgi:hypothetical protein
MCWGRIDQTLWRVEKSDDCSRKNKEISAQDEMSYKKKVCYCANYAFWLNWSAAELQSWIPILMRKGGRIPTWSSCTSPKNPQFTKWEKKNLSIPADQRVYVPDETWDWFWQPLCTWRKKKHSVLYCGFQFMPICTYINFFTLVGTGARTLRKGVWIQSILTISWYVFLSWYWVYDLCRLYAGYAQNHRTFTYPNTTPRIYWMNCRGVQFFQYQFMFPSLPEDY